MLRCGIFAATAFQVVNKTHGKSESRQGALPLR